MQTVLIDYKSDFDILLILYGKDGAEIPFKDIDFSAEFSTPSTPEGTVYSASKLNGVLTNCSEDSGRIRVSFAGHHLLEGTLQVKFTQIGGNSIYALNTVMVPRLIGIELLSLQDIRNPVTDAIMSIGVRNIAVEVPSEEYMQDLIAKGYATPGTLYFTAEAEEEAEEESQQP